VKGSAVQSESWVSRRQALRARQQKPSRITIGAFAGVLMSSSCGPISIWPQRFILKPEINSSSAKAHSYEGVALEP
jgi:hypothetical protein